MHRPSLTLLAWSLALYASGCGLWIDANAPKPPDASDGMDAGLLDEDAPGDASLDARSLDARSLDARSLDALHFDGGPDAPLACFVDDDCNHLDDACHHGVCTPSGCVSEPYTDGADCSNPAACTTGACMAGACMSAPMDCTHFDDACHVGMCAMGTCSPSERPAGTACNDGDICTWSSTCSAGTCGMGILTDCVVQPALPEGPPTMTFGRDDMINFVDRCPRGQVMVGIRANITGGTFYIGMFWQYETLCAALEVTTDGMLRIVPGSTLPDASMIRGDYDRGVGMAGGVSACPLGEVVVGFEMGTDVRHPTEATAEDRFPTRLGVRCAPLAVDGDVNAGFRARIGAAHATTPIGVRLGDRTNIADCGPEMVAIGSTGFSGEVLNNVAFLCGTPHFTVVTTSPLPSLPGPNLFRQDCPFGYVPVGVEAVESDADATGRFNANFTQFATRCARLNLRNSAGTWTARTGSADFTTRPQGSRVGSSNASLMCPTDNVIVGYSGSVARDGVTQLALHCAPVNVTGTMGSLRFGHGAIGIFGPSGSRPSTAFGPATCPDGLLGHGFYGSAADVVDTLALRCAVPTFFITP